MPSAFELEYITYLFITEAPQDDCKDKRCSPQVCTRSVYTKKSALYGETTDCTNYVLANFPSVLACIEHQQKAAKSINQIK